MEASLPTSPIIPASGTIEQHPPPSSEPAAPVVMMATHELSADLAPKKKPRKSSMPVKIEERKLSTPPMEFGSSDGRPQTAGLWSAMGSHDNHTTPRRR